MDNQRNFLLAAILSLGVVFAWQALIVQPRIDRERAIAEQQEAAKKPATTADGTVQPSASGDTAVPAAPSAGTSNAGVPGSGETTKPVAESARVALKSGKLEGSINLRGARIDDLKLIEYREKVDKSSPAIKLLKPGSNENGYFAEFGFSPNEALGKLPGPSTDWKLASGETLSASSPITLEFVNGKGLTFQRTIAVDENYMFNITDTVRNNSPAAVTMQPYGRIARYGEPKIEGIYVLHEGLIGSIGEQGLDEIDYDDIKEAPGGLISREPDSSGWFGMTDKYWATALVPTGKFTARYRYVSNSRPFYQTEYSGAALSVPAGGEASTSTRLFAGAKKVDIIESYKDTLNIPLFDKMIDWGWFYWITKPMFTWLLNPIFLVVGNFGVAILLVTVLLKLFFFPLANKSYKSMANMKMVQPEMTAIRERFADDRPAQQKAMMELYKKEKINPAAGCWPVLIQIPVFFALYKVLYVTIEMRHAPFFGWIQDLSGPDPTSIFNLFGLMPWSVPAFLMIGVWPLLMGITMFIQMQMNPTPPDPTQQMIFKWMPVMFTFMLATFPAGLVIYWAWNNFLSIIQQGTIMKRQGAKIELWDNLKGMFSKKTEAS